MILTHRARTTVVIRVGTGPAHLARQSRTGYRLACGRTVTADRCTVMGRKVWTHDGWRPCASCARRSEVARNDTELFA